MREKILSVTLNDCDVQTFRAGGPGGQNQNKRDTAVRIIHRESGARAESRTYRTQLENKRAAFKKMVATAEFKSWLHIKTSRIESSEVWVDRQMWAPNIKTEVREAGRWVETV